MAGPGSQGLGPGSCVGHSGLPWLVLSIRGLAHSQYWAEPSETQLLAGQEARCLCQACVQSWVLVGGPGDPGCGEGSSVVTADRPARFPCPLLKRTRGPDTSSKATQWVKAQHEGALSPSCISGNTRRFHTQLNKGPETP